MLTKLGGQVESLTSHFVASLVVSRILSFAFWLYGFKEIAPLNGKANIAGHPSDGRSATGEAGEKGSLVCVREVLWFFCCR